MTGKVRIEPTEFGDSSLDLYEWRAGWPNNELWVLVGSGQRRQIRTQLFSETMQQNRVCLSGVRRGEYSR